MNHPRVQRFLAAAIITLVCAPRASAYSVLAHEAVVDAVWDGSIQPLLKQRFPAATKDDLEGARAYAYGGSVIQDLGYYPFGSHFFSNLLHYVRSGDFVETLIADATTVDELAFALGALTHFVADNTGHPEAVNVAVAIEFPKLRAKYGKSITYFQSRASHVLVEFSFDVVQAAGGAYLPERYHSFIGFEVAKPLLERAFADVYGLQMKDVFASEDLSISTYRHSVSQTIPEITQIAWRDKREDIAKLMPGVQQNAFVYNYTRQEFEKDFGASYLKPGLLARFLGMLYKLLPKVGPLRPLEFKAPPAEAERLFTASFLKVRQRAAAEIADVRRGRLTLQDTNYDTGEPSVFGKYALSDDTYIDLLTRLERQNTPIPDGLRAHMRTYGAAVASRATKTRDDRKRAARFRDVLAKFDAVAATR